MKNTILLLFFVFTLSLTAQNNTLVQKDKTSILAIMKAQEIAWSNNDLEGFMQGYWKSDSLKFYGSSGLTKGWQQTLDNYKTVAVQVLKIDDAFIVNLQGELFVEYSLDIKEKAGEKVFVTCCANGEMQGYIVTEEATGYEADNALFTPETGKRMMNKAVELIEQLR